MLRLLPVLLATSLVAPVGRADGGQTAGGASDASLAPPKVTEFPFADQQIQWLQSRGLSAKLASLRLVRAPYQRQTIALLMAQRRYEDVFKILGAVLEQPPAQMAEVFGGLVSGTRELANDKSHPYAEDLRAIVDRAKRRIAEFPREDAGRVARELVTVEANIAFARDTYRARLLKFVDDYRGTDAALLAQVDLLEERIGPGMLDALDAFVRDHPRTMAAAKALHLKGFHLAHNAFSFGERKGADPTDRFFRVFEVYEELRSGRYPPCEWVDKAASLVAEFSSYEPQYAPANVDRLLKAYESILPALLAKYERDPAQDTVSFVVGSKMGALFKLKGHPVDGIEGVFDRLERTAAQRDAVWLLRAEFYLRPDERVIEVEDRPVLKAKARVALETLIVNGGGFYRQKALATLARLAFGEGQYAEARVRYEMYLSLYPQTGYAWVAALRSAQSIEALGDPAAAVPLFVAASQRFSENPLAQVLGRAYGARAAEAAGEYAAALDHYQAALAAWDADYGLTYSLYSTRPATPGNPFMREDDAAVERDALALRIAELSQAVHVDGGDLLERARWMLRRERWVESRLMAEEFLASHPDSPIAAAARLVRNTARLQTALDLVDVDKPPPDIDRAIAELKALGDEEPDFAVVAARVALATIVTGTLGDPDAVMVGAMRMWQSLDAGRSPASGALERDVVEVRNAVFRPTGGGIFDSGQWDSYRWSSAPAFFTVNPQLRVKLAGGEIRTLTAYDRFPEFPNVLFLSGERRKLLERVMLKLGGAKRRAWTQVMATPNQPAGPAVDIAVFWRKYFWTQPGHWGGWVFESYPIVTEIEFVDSARTRAAVKITVGYSGATVQMEKKDGVWLARELTNFWIT